MIGVCECPIVADGITKYNESKFGGDFVTVPDATKRPFSECSTPSPSESEHEKIRKWSGSDFVTSPTMEPWVKYFFWVKLKIFI